MPATRNRVYFGTGPKGVSSPSGLVTVTTEPTFTPSSSAISLPSKTGGIAARRCSAAASESALSPEDEGVLVSACADDLLSEVGVPTSPKGGETWGTPV